MRGRVRQNRWRTYCRGRGSKEIIEIESNTETKGIKEAINKRKGSIEKE